MREYKIYIIQKDIAYEYYGLEEKLFKLFAENSKAKGRLKEITDKQIQYIIENIPVALLERFIYHALKGDPGYKHEYKQHFIQLTNINSKAQLIVENDQLTLVAEGTYDAEARFYEILREFHPFFLALEYKEKRYGWLKPLKFVETG